MAQQAVALTDQEKRFFSRAAIKVANEGLSFDAACEAVLADDRATHAKIAGLNAWDRDLFARKLGKQVYALIHMRSALAA